ncbi:nagb/rpia/CoA transferase-like protein [Xylariomycetidae sp. FL2044]|nr:nagb/rpia/CoA transferase-like protein [Xylariomycetidae sp. FL2044]
MKTSYGIEKKPSVMANPDALLHPQYSIVKTYHRLLADDPEITMPVAAIEALIEALGASKATTVFETMDLVKTQSARLRAAVANPIALSHGTDLFQQYLVITLKQPAGPNGSGEAASSTHENFEVVRQHLLRNGRLFAARAKEAREKIATVGRPFIRDNCTILTHGGSRVVGTLLGRAAEATANDARRRFKVIHVLNEARMMESNRVVAALRAKGVQVATVSDAAAAYVMRKADMVIVGAEAVTAQGGIISRMGTYQIAMLAKAFGKDFYVAAEQHKFGKTFPLNQDSLQFQRDFLEFYSSKNQPGDSKEDARATTEGGGDQPVDFTPPAYITSFFADHGVLSPADVAKEVIDMMF